MSDNQHVPTANSGKATAYPKIATGWHVLEVEGYSKIKGVLGIGKSIKSGTFEVGGHSWCIACFPDGFNDESAQWVGVDLHLVTHASAGDIKLRLLCSLLDQVGEPVSAYTDLNPPWLILTETDIGIGHQQFIERTVLESSYLKDDCFKIRCDVTVISDICMEPNSVVSLTAPPPDLHCHLGALLDSKVGSDVTFEVGGEHFTAHRVVLAARSPVFMAELFGPMKENFTSHVKIDDIEAKAFKVFLQFIYTDSLPEIEEGDKIVMAQHLLVAADRYNMERLKLICEGMLSKYIDSSLVATTLVLSEQHGCHGLKEACFNFLKSPGNLIAAMASDGFPHLKSSCPYLLEEMLTQICSVMSTTRKRQRKE